MIPDQFRLIATSAAIVRCAGPAGAIWLGNALSAQEWSEKEHGEDWWHAKKSEIEERTGLSDEMQETARRRLRDLGVLEERRGILKRGASLATIWYHVDTEKLSAIVCRESRQTDAGKAGKRIPENPAGDHASLTASLSTSAEAPLERPAPEPKRRKARPPFQEPTLDEWVAFCHERWPWMPRSHAEQSWNHYHFGAVDGRWFQKDGTPVKVWKQCANTSHGLFMSQNPDAQTRWKRLTQTASRQPVQAATPAASVTPSWIHSPEWKAHLAKCESDGKGAAYAMRTFRAST